MIIELTTGAAFLMSSLFAAGPTQIIGQISNLAAVPAAQAQTIEIAPSLPATTPVVASSEAVVDQLDGHIVDAEQCSESIQCSGGSILAPCG